MGSAEAQLKVGLFVMTVVDSDLCDMIGGSRGGGWRKGGGAHACAQSLGHGWSKTEIDGAPRGADSSLGT